MKAKEIIYNTVTTPIRFLQNLVDKPAIILIYHRVIKLNNDRQRLAVKPENFYKQIEFLKDNYNILQADEFAKMLLGNKEFPTKSILLTFDDGYADNYLNAVPILESLNVQSIFYITTSMIDSTVETWWDSLENVFFNNKLPADLLININGTDYHFKTSTLEEIEKTYLVLHPLIKYTESFERERVINFLHDWSNCQRTVRESYRFLTSEELKKMSESKSVVIGAHTNSHTPLSILNSNEQFEDISASVKEIKKITGIDVKHFSYPFGVKKDYNNETINICKKMGFKFVCANYYSQVHSWTSPFQLPRILVRNWNFNKFKENLDRFFRY